MRAAILTIAVIATVVMAPASALATQFSFDPVAVISPHNTDFSLPVSLVAIVSLLGGLVILLERKKARGIWFSNNERLR